MYAGLFDAAETATLSVADNRRLYVHVARGKITANGVALEAGDALKLTDTRRLELKDGQKAEAIVFDLPM